MWDPTRQEPPRGNPQKVQRLRRSATVSSYSGCAVLPSYGRRCDLPQQKGMIGLWATAWALPDATQGAPIRGCGIFAANEQCKERRVEKVHKRRLCEGREPGGECKRGYWTPEAQLDSARDRTPNGLRLGLARDLVKSVRMRHWRTPRNPKHCTSYMPGGYTFTRGSGAIHSCSCNVCVRYLLDFSYRCLASNASEHAVSIMTSSDNARHEVVNFHQLASTMPHRSRPDFTSRPLERGGPDTYGHSARRPSDSMPFRAPIMPKRF